MNNKEIYEKLTPLRSHQRRPSLPTPDFQTITEEEEEQEGGQQTHGVHGVRQGQGDEEKVEKEGVSPGVKGTQEREG